MLLSAAAPAIWATRVFAQAAPGYPITIENLRLGTKNEMAAHFRFVAFSKKADSEGYKGIAYMFTALATSRGAMASVAWRFCFSLTVPPENGGRPEINWYRVQPSA